MDTDLKKNPIATPAPVQDNDQEESGDTDPVFPMAVTEHLNSKETFDVLQSIEKEFSIPKDKIGAVPFVISTIISGELDPLDTVEALQLALETTKENALKISGIIKDKILNPIAAGLLIAGGIDIEPMPGPSARDAKDLPSLVRELEPYLSLKSNAPEAKKPTPNGPNLEPLIVAPKSAETAPARPAMPGMETPGLRTMKDVKAPAMEPKKMESAKIEPKVVETPRPFMLHEEKPLAPTESAALHVKTNFSFDAGPAPITKTQPRAATAELGSSFDAILDKKKPVAPVTAKTVEAPKVVHYTSMRTPLDNGETPKR